MSEFMRAIESGSFQSVADLERNMMASASFFSQVLVSPFHDAAARGNLPALKELLDEPENNVTVGLLDNAKNTALHWSAGAGHVDVVQFLIEKAEEMQAKEIILNAQNLLGDTALHRAVWRQQQEVVRVLMEQNIDPNIRNTMGQRAIDLVRDNTAIGCILMEAKVLPGLYDSDESNSYDDDSFEMNLSDTEYSSEDESIGALLAERRLQSLFVPPETAQNEKETKEADQGEKRKDADATVATTEDVDDLPPDLVDDD